ncbi:hypothetical protein A2X44_05485 [candidate division CPR3 bacterium GWF2_35_18]|uniref:Integral membrane protein DUF6 n=1 Tax=candidate division CPR3 bacterium GW2011_GWF2_35_18 TaxID=1618350 RepID=A0A0G0BHL0_UNCC3|nr:MAG: Integral membrane protein DUF6 [candidate division CPR3 bacterium GW2011_GWF2_35_18]OGB63203.1 MAG: hypothetical protein A2X44_05485 [candidate division CPR3 bacterium GWF2_35_18]OGB64117.1 MAG: hypothetical protein A2250_03645 [candidate division CPR3 bacterium RIFOXYA2_FULL_35_13]OGB75575.1 MAG: hypothetical protein A2476_01760 [candidate division CPR3 bacterium RIFOXYC2_FULL_35_7]
MWFLYALLSAAFSGFSIIINKKALQKLNPTVVTWGLFVIPIPFLLLGVLNSPRPELTQLFFIGVFSSSVVFFLAKTLSLKSMRDNLLSRLIPLGAFSTLFNYLIGLFLLDEHLKITAVVGIIAIIIGVYIFNLEEKNRFLDPFILLYKNRYARIFLIAMFLTSLSTLFDKIAITNMNPTNPYLPYLIEDIIMGGVMTIYLSIRNKDWTKQVKMNLPLLLLAGIVYMGVGITVFLGFANGPLVLITGVKKLEIVIVLLLSYLLFKDKPNFNSLLGTFIMILGVVLIKI